MTVRTTGAVVAPWTRRRAATVLLTGLLALGPAAAAAGEPTPATTPATGPVPGVTDGDALPVTVEILSVTPQVLAPGEDLVVTARVHNTGTEPLVQPRVVLHLDRGSFISRSSLDLWRDADLDGETGDAVLNADLPGTLVPGGTLDVTMTLPASSVGLRSAASLWGPRGLALVVVDLADPARARQGVARTFTLWFPEQEVTPTRVSVLVPVVGPAVDPATGTWPTALEVATAPGGRLANLLTATAAHPEVTWVVDPWLVEATADDAGSTPAPAPATWSQALLAAMATHDVHLMPYGDLDLAAVAHAEATVPEQARDVLHRAVERGRAVAGSTDLPDNADATVAWPADPLPDLVTAAFAIDTGSRAVVVGPGELPAPDVLTYTPTGRTTVSVGGREVTVLIPDERLSTALSTGVVRGSQGEGTPDPQTTPATAAQDLLAELAVITRERPNDPRHLLITAPRDWTPDPAVASAQLAALRVAPWIRAAPVTALIGAGDTGVERDSLPGATPADPGEISAAEISSLLDAVEVRATLSRLAEDPGSLLGDLDPEVVLPASVAWRGDPAGRSALVARSTALTQSLRGAVVAAPSPSYNLVSTSGDIPVLVTNTLDQPVTVQVALLSDNPRLVAGQPETVTIAAGGEQTVRLPVRAIQSADLVVRVELRTAEGAVINADTAFEVHVRADWEGIGTAIIGALLALGLVVGVIRTIRRGRTGTRAAPQADSGPDALSPEEADDDGTVRSLTPPPHDDAPAGPSDQPDAGRDVVPATGPGQAP